MGNKFFTRKNTPELREKLKAMGYRICACCTFKNSVWLDMYTDNMSVHGIGYFDPSMLPINSVEEALQFFLNENEEHGYPYYDCGESEELFLEMAKKGKENQ